ncbi:phage portal protein family protein, partial [Klebsiella pneumoniae]|uniref:phage portal protein family protein n=1 Tax=Klebsiella pneumoniae TaxID=573 RepID=UPI0022B61B90
QQTWAEFSEKFGIPLVTAETNKSEKKDLDRIEAMLNALGQSWSAIIPEGSTLTIHDVAGKSDPYNIWDRQIERCNSEISKR